MHLPTYITKLYVEYISIMLMTSECVRLLISLLHVDGDLEIVLGRLSSWVVSMTVWIIVCWKITTEIIVCEEIKTEIIVHE